MPNLDIFILLFIVTAIILFLPSVKDRSVLVWVIAALAGLLIHFLQHKGWPYHLLPGLAFVTIAFLLAALQLKHPLGQILGILAVSWCIHPGLADYQQTQKLPIARFESLMRGHHPRRMIMLTYDMGLSFPFLPANDYVIVDHRPFADTPRGGNENPLDSIIAYGDFASAWSHFKLAKDDGSFQLWQRQ